MIAAPTSIEELIEGIQAIHEIMEPRNTQRSARIMHNLTLIGEMIEDIDCDGEVDGQCLLDVMARYRVVFDEVAGILERESVV